jgi:hypothetical protein
MRERMKEAANEMRLEDKTKLRGLSPRTNYADRTTAT